MRSRVDELADATGAQPAYICGLVQNDKEVWDPFDVEICLILDEATIPEED